MQENILEFLSHIGNIILFTLSSTLFVFILTTTNQMKEAFQQSYNNQGILREESAPNRPDNTIETEVKTTSKTTSTTSKSTPNNKDEIVVSGSEIIVNVYQKLECPIEVDNVEILPSVDLSSFNFDLIEWDKQYRKKVILNTEGKVIRVEYYKTGG